MKPAAKLTSRETEVVTGMASGNTTKGIALKLGVSPKTVEYYRAQAYRKLGLHDVAGVTRYAIRERLISA